MLKLSWLKKNSWWMMATVLSLGFIWLRFYKIETSLAFFNDIGRDFLELWEWQKTGKPPLLGPQTSALPFNQSAVYFYLLMPMYLATGASLLSTIYTCGLVQAGLIWYGCWWLGKYQPSWQKQAWLLIFLLALQPQMIIQQRFVWNPSFVVGWLGVVIFASWQLVATPVKNWRWFWLAIWGSFISLAASFNYSVAPVVLGAGIISLIWWRWKAIKLWFWAAAGLLFWNLPTLIFELRHSFLLTKMMLHGDKISQISSSWQTKFWELGSHLVGLSSGFWGLAASNLSQFTWLIWVSLVAGWLILELFYWWQWRKFQNQFRQFSPRFIYTASWWLLSLGITVLIPVAVQAHYIFGLLILGLASLVSLPHWSRWLVIILLFFGWLQPSWFRLYWQPARQSLAELEACSQQICAEVKAPLFVSIQYGDHPYHNAMEYQYLLRRAGCDIKDIANFPESAKLMAVIIDDSIYEHGKTAFNELSLFGPSQVKKTISCQTNLQVYLLSKF